MADKQRRMGPVFLPPSAEGYEIEMKRIDIICGTILNRMVGSYGMKNGSVKHYARYRKVAMKMM
jgi:hypothetical protein